MDNGEYNGSSSADHSRTIDGRFKHNGHYKGSSSTGHVDVGVALLWYSANPNPPSYCPPNRPSWISLGPQTCYRFYTYRVCQYLPMWIQAIAVDGVFWARQIVWTHQTQGHMGPSIYDVHTEGGEGSDSGGRMWTEGGGPAPCGRPHKKLKLKSTDVILSSSRAKKLASIFYQNFVFGQKKSGNFSAI